MILTDRRRVILFCYVFFLPLLSVLLRGTPLPSYILAESETFRPYLLIGETGKNFDGTEEAIIQKFFMNDAEIIGRYRPVGDPDRYIFFVTTKQLKKASRNGGEHGLFLGVLHLAVDVKGEMVYLSVPNIDYWGNLLLREDFDRVTKAVGEFKTDLPRMLPKLRGRFMRPFGSTEPLTVDRLRTYQFMKRLPSMDDTIELGNFENHAKAIQVVEERLKRSSELTQLFRYDVIRKDATLFGVQIPQEREIAELLDQSERKATPFYPWQIAVVNGRVFSPAPLFKIPAGFPELTLRQLLKLRKLSTSIVASLKELEQ